MPERFWKVLLIGGNSGSGKTTLARALSLHFDVPWLPIDDFRLLLEHYTTKDQEPAVHHFTDLSTVYRNSPDVLVQWRRETAEVVSQAIEKNVANHASHGGPAILEGDDIVPELAVRQNYAGLDVSEGDVSAVFLIERDESTIEANMHERQRDFMSRSVVERRNQVQMSVLYGQWLVSDATRLGLPVVGSRPFESLVDRALALVGTSG